MALAIILRRSVPIQGLPSLLRGSNAAVTNTKCFSQFCKVTNNTTVFASKTKLNLVKTCLSKRQMSTDHGKLWTFEKVVTVALLGVFPITFISPSTTMDNICAVLTVAHLHWGLEACVIDYVRPIIFGPLIPKLTMLVLYAFSAALLGGLIYYNQNSIGIGQTFRKLWAVSSGQ